MTNGNINNILIPNVTRANSSKVSKKIEKDVNPNEFNNLLKETIESQQSEVKLSVHAAKMEDRNMSVDGAELRRFNLELRSLLQRVGTILCLLLVRGHILLMSQKEQL